MINIIFIRHGETEHNVKGLLTGRIDCSLTEKGIEEAKLLGKTLNNDFDAIYCSPLKRAKQTLNSIFPDCIPIYDDRIIERTCGIYDGKPKNSVSKENLELYFKGLYLAPGAEPIKDIDKRVCDFVKELFEKYNNNEKIFVVTHDGVLNSIKRNFVKDYEKGGTNNLGTVTLDNRNYEYYKEHIVKL